jgi:putative transposase
VIDAAVAVKRDKGERSAATVNLFLRKFHGVIVPRSTLYRHLKAHGATRLKLDIVKKKVRCRWTREKTNELWVGDFSDGPYVLTPEACAAQSHLSLFIDAHSRFVVEGRYYLRESFDILIDSLLRAWAVCGLSDELYLDNAKIYHANALKSACYALHIRLIHRTAGDPSPGGLVERFFGTNQSQFETEVRAGDILTLDHLNRAFQAWLHHYHNTVHSETKRTPAELYNPAVKRQVPVETALKFFMEEEIRTVHGDFSDVSLHGRFYAVDPRLRGDKVLVRFDPFGTLEKVLLYSLDEQFLGEGRRYQRDEKDRTPPVASQKKPAFNYIDLIVSQHEQYLQKKARGIDYASLPPPGRWPFGAFVSACAELLGKKAGMSAFSTEEIETLKKLYDRYPGLNAASLREAFTAAETKTIGAIALMLQKFNHFR